MSGRTGGDDRRAWGSIGLAVGLTLLLAGLDAASVRSISPAGRLLYLGESLFVFLPITAAVVAGQFVHVSRRRAAVILAFTTLAMIAIDFAPPSRQPREQTGLGIAPGSAGFEEITVPVKRWVRGGGIVVSFRYLTGQIPEAQERSVIYPRDSAPWSVGNALFKLAYLFTPFIGIGFVLGSQRWIGRNLLFRSRNAERVFLFSSAWIVGPLAVVLAGYFTSFVRDYSLISYQTLMLVLAPAILFSVVASFGWRAAARPLPSPAEMD